MTTTTTDTHTDRAAALLAAAAQWRAYGSTCALPQQQRLAEATARNLEQQAATGIAKCVCCGKAFGRPADIPGAYR